MVEVEFLEAWSAQSDVCAKRMRLGSEVVTPKATDENTKDVSPLASFCCRVDRQSSISDTNSDRAYQSHTIKSVHISIPI